ncbi:hypothetical protein ZYGR_0P00200 [Zygosaccharomyces rouxii]|uniref:ZYRO0E00616p n=2 Tax=Zygosaccharomyces rouxii TaxID=4956 RepID=C5E3V7_ZYGRC|nr:uncharacterized protein ZYRO0E00616g [Zygosaccharomyces rouxii]KAH9198419.1 hypothetical protein LQ764DRAFT_160021 [Zygosaccharomyces rouxii]GAV49377.1 hypothetical protein ZYGR_0P00200 [Zygosaccharomyces rouxii]CAR30718.1 ZYRO0E00616p [Zygosaccharomyces rouxii]
MFARFTRPLQKVAAARFYSQVSASATSKQANSKFDKSIIKPILVVIVFGTMLSHVMNQQRLAGEMERRYVLKMEILKDLIERARKGEINIDVQEELKLVNKLFERNKEARFLNDKEAEKLSQISSSQNYSEAEVLQSMNNSTRALEKESLDDLLKSIMDEVSDEPKSSARKSNPKPKQQQSGEFITDRDTLREKAEYERELLQYKPSTDVHLIVENPGELSSAAGDTKVSKFL